MSVAAVWGAAGVAATGAVAHGMFHRNSPLFGRVWSRLPTGERIVALTFDDGPNPRSTPLMLDVLASEDVRATFFVLGRYAERWPELVARTRAAGHEVANHGYHHRRLHFAGPAAVREDVSRGASAVAWASGTEPRFFRPPHGFRSPFVVPVAASLGQKTIGWSFGVWDSDRPGVKTIAARVISQAKPGAIILLHDGDGYDPAGDRTQTAQALPLIIAGLRRQGYAFSLLSPTE